MISLIVYSSDYQTFRKLLNDQILYQVLQVKGMKQWSSLCLPQRLESPTDQDYLAACSESFHPQPPAPTFYQP